MSDISKISIELLKLREKYSFLSDQTFITANNLVNKLYNTAKANKLWWYPPIISASDRDGGVYLEWKNKDRGYTLFVQDDEVDYYARQVNEVVEEGDINIENTLTEFWGWITN